MTFFWFILSESFSNFFLNFIFMSLFSCFIINYFRDFFRHESSWKDCKSSLDWCSISGSQSKVRALIDWYLWIFDQSRDKFYMLSVVFGNLTSVFLLEWFLVPSCTSLGLCLGNSASVVLKEFLVLSCGPCGHYAFNY